MMSFRRLNGLQTLGFCFSPRSDNFQHFRRLDSRKISGKLINKPTIVSWETPQIRRFRLFPKHSMNISEVWPATPTLCFIIQSSPYRIALAHSKHCTSEFRLPGPHDLQLKRTPLAEYSINALTQVFILFELLNILGTHLHYSRRPGYDDTAVSTPINPV